MVSIVLPCANEKAIMSSSPPEELFDIHVDTQFAKVDCRPSDYAREPWKHYRDGPKAYLSIREQKRRDFLQKVPPPMKRRVEHEIERIDRTRKNFSSYPNKKGLMKELDDSRKAWQSSVVENLNSFQAAADRDYEADPENPRYRRDRELLMRLESWRSRHSVQLSPPERRTSFINKVLRQGTFARRQSQAQPQVIVEEPSNVTHMSTTSTIRDEQIHQEPMYGFRASAIYFKKKGDEWTSHTHSHDKFIGKDTFPNQKIAVNDLLEGPGTESPLCEVCPPDTIRYFHFPTNNMSWIEKAIARYYREDFHVPIDERTTFNRTTRKTEKLLAREYWRGQMHGTGGLDRATFVHQDQAHSRTGRNETPSREPTTRVAPVHARHMRSRCFFIPRATSETYDSNKFGTEKNVALFMPYLHWETSSRRAKMVQVVNEAINSPDGSTSTRERLGTFSSAVARLEGNPQSVPSYKHHLGKYLMTIARVADEMDFEADERLLRENVNRNPPLHIRRTIDQYYFPTLEDTSLRDKDQVVYRGTRAGRSFHTKNTRVVMVDQLWLWILDDHTIITSFPRRWGRNKPDPSGVHKSLRERLEAMSGGIKSIHHLALMIIDQCSGVFFDRTKPLDQRPEVMDLFSSAIGHVTELTAVAYEGFWRNTALQARNFLTGSESTRHKYLEINPEGKLLQEAQDISEELQIMKRIYNEQLQVVKDFKRHLDHHPEAGRRKDEPRDMSVLLNKILDTMLHEKHKQSGNMTGETGRAPGSSTENIMPPVDQSSLEETVHEAGVLLELMESRKAEIQDKEDSALHTCQHIEGLLSLKQQQASIVEAKSAIRRADESIRQGRSIMAFTVVTIFFLPLGFFATFFGMNNLEINGATWMTLNEQIRYMFGLSTIVIVLSVSLAFSAWSRAVLSFLFWVPLAMLAESTGFRDWWRQSPAYHVNLERRAIKIVENTSKERKKRREKEREEKRLAREEAQSDGGRMVRVSGGIFDVNGSNTGYNAV